MQCKKKEFGSFFLKKLSVALKILFLEIYFLIYECWFHEFFSQPGSSKQIRFRRRSIEKIKMSLTLIFGVNNGWFSLQNSLYFSALDMASDMSAWSVQFRRVLTVQLFSFKVICPFSTLLLSIKSKKYILQGIFWFYFFIFNHNKLKASGSTDADAGTGGAPRRPAYIDWSK